MPYAEMKPVRVEHFNLNGWEDFGPALKWSQGHGFYGMINLDQTGTWRLSMARPGEEYMGRLDASVGNVLVWNGMSLTVMNELEFQEVFHVPDDTPAEPPKPTKRAPAKKAASKE